MQPPYPTQRPSCEGMREARKRRASCELQKAQGTVRAVVLPTGLRCGWRLGAGPYSTHRQREVMHARNRDQLGERACEREVGDGLLMQLGELQTVQCRQCWLMQLLPAAAPSHPTVNRPPSLRTAPAPGSRPCAPPRVCNGSSAVSAPSMRQARPPPARKHSTTPTPPSAR
jgi:hypothetical protein